MQVSRFQLILIIKFKQSNSMNYIRGRAAEKPMILQEIIFNHREQPNDASSDASFLKLSSKGSQQIVNNMHADIFTQMQNQLNRLEKTSIQKINEIHAKINKAYPTLKQQALNLFTERIQQYKQRAPVTYRKLQGHKYEKQHFQEGNFEMDENLNYIKSYQNQHMTPNLVMQSFQAKQLNSEPKFNKIKQIQQLQPYTEGRFNLKKRYSSTDRKNKLLQCQPNSKKEDKSCNKRESRKKSTQIKNRSSSSSRCKQLTKNNSGRVYQEILSLYSTAKLLAMQKSAI